MLDRKKADEEAEEEKEERNSGFGTRNDTREHERTEIMESKRNSKCSWNCLKECPHFFVVFGFVTLVYWNSLTGDFVHDDNPAILQNPMVTDANTSIWNILTHDFWGTQLDSSASHKSFRPITTLVFRLIYSVQISDSPGILFCASQGFQILSLLICRLHVRTDISGYEILPMAHLFSDG
ncbi:hypothetical protein TCAL_01098 [Tigriopus californicus]|uniref:Uncharacterized protein n=1 Tax=Tigriopus californicus TaxID=6832 RepID=A0A553P1H6_TIGCA|nr:hypothetical protein TCAL_01098 [Tigriopus californicus]